ncbi:major facilitator superfamily domain-containing protein [Zopfochytrium polystomum]|nr:major facilitator superfamily domain-containing protein [Zopfochytrium polystomum]
MAEQQQQQQQQQQTQQAVAPESTISLANLKTALTNLYTEPITKPQNPWTLLTKLNRRQWLTFGAAFLGWSLDAMDYFLLTLAVPDIVTEFKKQDSWITTTAVTQAITITLLLRPVGALAFGLAGDRWGRRWPLMANVIMYSILELCSGFAPNYAVFLFIRALFGIAMGGEWGLGASLAMEAIPPECRGLFSGILQQGYAFGNLLASGLYYAIYARYPNQWRVLFYVGCFPAVLVIFIRFFVPESEAYNLQNERRAKTNSNFLRDIGVTFKAYAPRAIYCIILMSCFNFFSHGSQDLYPTYITTTLGYSSDQKAATVAISSTGAIIGGTIIGYFGQYFGRRRAIILCAFCAGCIIYPWAFSPNLPSVQVAGFFMQFFVQGAWGCVPSYLTEISPPAIRATFPGLMYNIGNMVSASSATIESAIGDKYPTINSAGKEVPNYGLTQAIFIGITVVGMIITISIGKEARNANLEPSSEVNVDPKKSTTDVFIVSSDPEAK